MTFFVPPNQVLKGKGKYCSLSCSASIGGQAVHQKHDLSGEHNPNYKGGLAVSKYQYKLRHEARHPEKALARRILRQAIRSNQIERQPCETCAGTENLQAHHDDYTQPLNVRWFCAKHHRMLHGASH